MLTPAQLATVKADFTHRVTVGDPLFSQALKDAAFSGNDQVINDFYNALAAPDYFVWRTSVARKEVVESTVDDAGTPRSFSWTEYIGRSQGERDAFDAIFATSGIINPSLASIRQAFGDIFSGGAAGNIAQRAYLTAVGRRKASLVEKLLATGAGTAVAPSVAGFEGTFSEGGSIR